MKYLEEFIELYSDYLFKKYYLSKLYEEEYVDKFAEIEIENMKNLYEYFVLDYKIENTFMFPKFSGIIPIENSVYQNLLIDGEHEDLQKQILNLKNRKNNSGKNIRKLKKLNNDNTFENLKLIVRKANPDVNCTKESINLWYKFIERLENGDLSISKKIIEEFEALEDYGYYGSGKSMKELCSETKSKIRRLERSYPYNLGILLNSKKLISEKKKELYKDLQKSKDALDRISTIYLQINESEGLRS